MKRETLIPLALPVIFGFSVALIGVSLAQEPAGEPAPPAASGEVLETPPPPEGVTDAAKAVDAQSLPTLEAGDPDELLDANERQISAAQAIANLQRAKLQRQERLVLSKIEDLETYEYQNVRGANEAEAMKTASLRALKSAAARLYFDDYILLGRDLLEPYLGFYGDRFVARNTVLSRRILADGTNELDVRVSIDVQRLYEDLNEKHFIAKPEIRPLMAVSLEEKIDGQPTTDGRGRKLLEQALADREMRVASDKMGQFPLYLNASQNENVLLTARHEAQRGGIGAIVTGSLDVTSRPGKTILYDEFYFFTAVVKLDLIRVDTGEILASAAQSFSSSDVDADKALTSTFEQLMSRVSEPLTEGFLSNWHKTLFDVGEVRLMITGVNQEQLESVFNILKTVSPDVKTYTKSFFGDVAVLNVSVPREHMKLIEQYLRTSHSPQFVVKAIDERRFELKVL